MPAGQTLCTEVCLWGIQKKVCGRWRLLRGCQNSLCIACSQPSVRCDRIIQKTAFHCLRIQEHSDDFLCGRVM